MDNRRNGYEIWQALSRFSPDIFAHPVWVSFIYGNKPISNELILALQEQSQQFVASGDVWSACQVLLICAALQKRIEKFEASLDCLQRAWELADSHKMPEIVEWAAWGSSALHILLGQPDLAINSLRWLSSQLSGKGDWVLADLVELFATELADRAKGIKSVEIPLDWLIKWGELSGSLNGTHSDRATSKGSFVQPMRNALSTFLTKASWHSVWTKLKLITAGQNSLAGIKKKGPDERTLKSTNDIPLPSLSNQLSEEQYTQIDNVTHPLDLMSPGFTHVADAFITSSIAVENISQKLPPKAEDGKVVLAVYCLGQFRVSLENQWISSWPSGKGKSILKFMIVNYPRPISKDVLMDTLWRDADPVSARNNLYVAIYGLRQAFKTALPGFNPILFEEDRYCLDPDISVWLDVNEFMRYYQNGLDYERRGRLVDGIREYELAESLYQGDFFEEDLYEDWPVPRREALKDTYLIILDRLSRYYFDEERYAICIQTCQKILAKDNFREDTYRRLMRCYCRQGQRPLALRQYHLCTEVLARELGVPPTQETTALYDHIRNEGVV